MVSFAVLLSACLSPARDLRVERNVEVEDVETFLGGVRVASSELKDESIKGVLAGSRFNEEREEDRLADFGDKCVSSLVHLPSRSCRPLSLGSSLSVEVDRDLGGVALDFPNCGESPLSSSSGSPSGNASIPDGILISSLRTLENHERGRLGGTSATSLLACATIVSSRGVRTGGDRPSSTLLTSEVCEAWIDGSDSSINVVSMCCVPLLPGLGGAD